MTNRCTRGGNKRTQSAAIIQLLEPLMPWINDNAVSDLVYNGQEQWFVERSGVWERLSGMACGDRWVRRLFALVATQHRVRVSEQFPFLSATLSFGARLQGVLPPVSEHPILAIRLFRPSLHWKRLQETLTYRDHALATNPEEQIECDTSDWSSHLQSLVKNKKTMLLAGATSSGKTTLLKALLSLCEPHERLIILEDSPEFFFSNDSHVLVLRSQTKSSVCGRVPLSQLLRTSLRLRPDRIIIGEIRGEEAFDFLSACQTGHLGLLATIHAGSPKEARDRLVQLCLSNSRCRVPLSVLQEWVNNSVSWVVQCAREGKRFTVCIEGIKNA